ARRSRPKTSKNSSRKLLASASSRCGPFQRLAKARARERISSRERVRTAAGVGDGMLRVGCDGGKIQAQRWFMECWVYVRIQRVAQPNPADTARGAWAAFAVRESLRPLFPKICVVIGIDREGLDGPSCGHDIFQNRVGDGGDGRVGR